MIGTDPDTMRYAAQVIVWVSWFLSFVFLLLLFYRPTHLSVDTYVIFSLLIVLFMAFNSHIHYRVITNRPIAWQWMLIAQAETIVLITVAVVATGGFSHFFLYLLYYPSLALFAVLFTSFRLNLAWVTVTAIVYAVICLVVGDGLDLEARDDKTLIARIAVMYAVVVAVNLISRFERIRRWEALERERALHQERVELSRAIHDTTAQTAYLIGLGMDTAMELAGDSNSELTATLAGMSELSRSAMWELSHPIAAGSIFEGRGLGRVLESHVGTFTAITSVPVEMVQTGTEPPLTMETRTRLFGIAHNALTNAFRHARASSVRVGLDFEADCVRLSISDDGVGLPGDYAERGQGFGSMTAAAEQLGGRLIVETGGRNGGTAVTCVVPHE